MKSFRFITCMLLLPILVEQHAFSQDRPTWVNGYFNDLDRSYIKTATATGFTEEEALSKAIGQIIGARSQEAGIRVEINIQPDGQIITHGKDELTVKARVIDEYRTFEDGRYRVSVLAQVAKNPTLEFESVTVTDKYGFMASAFVPGMAQLQKGSKGKAAFFIGAEAVFIGGIIASECMRVSYESKLATTHNVELKQSYINNANLCSNIRNIAIAGVAVVYVWNVIDGIAAKGKKHIVIAENTSLDILPYVSQDSGGIALCFNF